MNNDKISDFYFEEAKYDEVYSWTDGTKRDYEHWNLNGTINEEISNL